jgi:hypothetical protein
MMADLPKLVAELSSLTVTEAAELAKRLDGCWNARRNFNHFFGNIVLDPFKDADQNRVFKFEAGGFAPNDPPGVYPIHNMAHYKGVLLSMHFIEDDLSQVDGSAVMIAPGIALAAAHVINPNKSHIMAGKLRVLCVGYTSTGPRFWRLSKVYPVGNTDLVILPLIYASALPDDNLFVQASVTTRLPVLGEQIMIAGLRASDELIPVDEKMSFRVKDGRIVYGAPRSTPFAMAGSSRWCASARSAQTVGSSSSFSTKSRTRRGDVNRRCDRHKRPACRSREGVGT